MIYSQENGEYIISQNYNRLVIETLPRFDKSLPVSTGSFIPQEYLFGNDSLNLKIINNLIGKYYSREYSAYAPSRTMKYFMIIYITLDPKLKLSNITLYINIEGMEGNDKNCLMQHFGDNRFIQLFKELKLKLKIPDSAINKIAPADKSSWHRYAFPVTL